jgi:hypothetical protein
MEIWGGIGRGMRGFFSGLVRGVSNACEGSKILTFPFRPRLMCSSLLHLRSSWKGCSANFALTAFFEVRLNRILGSSLTAWLRNGCRNARETGLL